MVRDEIMKSNTLQKNTIPRRKYLYQDLSFIIFGIMAIIVVSYAFLIFLPREDYLLLGLGVIALFGMIFLIIKYILLTYKELLSYKKPQ
jgi:hypothetical protein